MHIELWLMSCRVLKRDMELAMLDRLVEEAQNRGIREIYGYYYPTAKNSMVKELFGTFGFSRIEEEEKGNTIWKLDCSEYTPKNKVISIKKESIV